MQQSIWFLPELGQSDSTESNACQNNPTIPVYTILSIDTFC